MAIRTFAQINGRWTISKDPNSKLKYSGDIEEWLMDAGSPISEVEAITVGVTATAGKTGFSGSVLYAQVEGLDVTTEESVNSLTWRVTLVDGQEEDFTIYFTRQDG